MKNISSLAFCALVTPAIIFSSGSVLAQQPTNLNSDRQQQSTQDQRGEQNTRRPGQSDSQTTSDRQNTRDQNRTQNQSYMNSAPANGLQASNLIGADVKTTGNEKLGSVDDLIIDDKGQIVAILVGVGGFLGMGQKDVAISWNQVTKSGPADKPELRVNATRDHLRSAPEFKARK